MKGVLSVSLANGGAVRSTVESGVGCRGGEGSVLRATGDHDGCSTRGVL